LVRKESVGLKLFLRSKPVKMLVKLRSHPKYATILSKEVDCTYSHTVKILDVFNNLKLVEFEKRGRIKIVKLTDTGESVARLLEALISKLSKLA
jgi:DNA-binding MarR family transcriptional regulator